METYFHVMNPCIKDDIHTRALDTVMQRIGTSDLNDIVVWFIVQGGYLVIFCFSGGGGGII